MTPENRYINKTPVNGEHHLRRAYEPYLRIDLGTDGLYVEPVEMQAGRWYEPALNLARRVREYMIELYEGK